MTDLDKTIFYSDEINDDFGKKHIRYDPYKGKKKTVAERRENMLWFRAPEKVYIKRGCLPVALEELKNVMDKKKLFYLGYERRDLVENAGEYSIRGGIIDIGITKETGIRIELWGDEVDSIREFNIMSQRSTEKVKTAKIYPATEFVRRNRKNRS